MLLELSQNKTFMLSLQAWHTDQTGCDGTAYQQLVMGATYVATPCDVYGAQGLRRIKSCDVCGWCDVCLT